MESNYALLIRKIDEFIRKYYKNQLIRGLLYSLAALGAYYILIVLLEYISWFNIGIRSILFYTFVATAAFIITRFIVIPVSHIIRLGRIINHEQAAQIIGKHFGEVKDVLLNTLQLHQLEQNTNESNDLIRASIDQKIKHLQPVPFADAVDLKKNRKYLPYALPPLIFVLAALLISPSLILAPSQRIINHNVVFERPAPFSIRILNDKLQAVQQDDFTVKVKIEGDEIPAQLYIRSSQANYVMEKESNVLYSYTFRNLQQNTPFLITADKYNSKEYIIKILPKPIILSFDILAEYPAYLVRKSENISNTGDLTVPAGTRLTWKFFTRDTRKLLFRMGGKLTEIVKGKSNTFTQSARMLSGMPYSVIIGNEYFSNRDSLSYLINVIPDLYPSISVEEFKDSVYDNRLYYQGTVKDDYGLSKLVFAWSVKKAESDSNSPKEVKTRDIQFDKSLLQQQFYYFMDMSTLFVQPGDEVEYYFEIWDNDGVTGNKSTRSDLHIFKIPTLDEIEEITEKKNSDIKDKMESVIRQSQSLQQKVEDMQKKMVDKKEVGWQEKQTLQQLLDKQKSLQEQVQKIQKENKEKSLHENQYMETPPEIIEKQKQLEDLFNKVMTEDMKKMYEELQRMLENIDKDKVAEMLEKMKNDTKGLEKELDRNLELFKQLEVEQKLQQTIDKLDKLSEDQNKLGEETKNTGKENPVELFEKQEDLNKQFDQLKDDINELHKKNSELEEPNKLERTDAEEKEIDQDMENSTDQLKNGKAQKASQSQKSASGKMKNLSEKLTKMQQDMESEEEGEDVEALRQILDNLVKISLDQEDIMNQLNSVSTTNPKYLKIIQQQNNLKEDLQQVADSLYALSKRQASIEPFILRELTAVNNNMEGAVSQLNSRDVASARAKQQYAMTSVNNLALMLSESLNQMQQNMQSGGSGKSGSKSKKPGMGQGKMKSLRQLQEQLNKQLQEMREGLANPGKPGTQGQKQMSEKFARMAAQQEALRRQMQQYGQELQNEGTGVDKGIKEMMQQMEQTETDLVNKRLNIETIRRQQEIVTRMLESEKAEQQRELDQQRESEEARDIYHNKPSKYMEYNKIMKNETELFRTVPPSLKPFYKSKVNAYFLSFEK
ncbi:MAG: hypothetical protein WC780_07120 [Lentimicrobiaceae bacterium]|jgi:hypothetical protein